MKTYLIAALAVSAVLAITKPFDPVRATRGATAINKASSSEAPQRFVLPMQVGGLSVAMAFGR